MEERVKLELETEAPAAARTKLQAAATSGESEAIASAIVWASRPRRTRSCGESVTERVCASPCAWKWQQEAALIDGPDP